LEPLQSKRLEKWRTETAPSWLGDDAAHRIHRSQKHETVLGPIGFFNLQKAKNLSFQDALAKNDFFP
jgi:hypothetical protein